MTGIVLEAFRRGITTPSATTLKRYGLSAEDWLGLLAAQDWKCPICERDAAGLTLNTDHEHIRGFDKMTEAEKKPYTRGILCAYCNHRRVHSSLSGAMALRVAIYIIAYELRKAAA